MLPATCVVVPGAACASTAVVMLVQDTNLPSFVYVLNGWTDLIRRVPAYVRVRYALRGVVNVHLPRDEVLHPHIDYMVSRMFLLHAICRGAWTSEPCAEVRLEPR